MLSKIKFAAGSTPDKPSLEVDLTALTVFVGPNNSGKSQALREIENWMRTPVPSKGGVVEKIEFQPWDNAELVDTLSIMEKEPEIGDTLQADHVFLEKLDPQNNRHLKFQVQKSILLQEAQNPNATRSRYFQFTSLCTLKLDGTNRLALTNEQPSGDLLSNPPNLLAHLFANTDVRHKLRKIVHDAFGRYLVIDPTNIGKLRLRLSSVEPTTESQELGWDSNAQDFHRNAIGIDNASDGVKAFVGILATILGGEPIVTLLDEPEAFLHPALSTILGKELTVALGGSKKRIFVSTHSANFLMGCFQAGAEINIVRLTYINEEATARILKREDLAPLMMNPLLRSVGVLNGLFYNSVVVTESDSDRAFYQEINERLLAKNDPRGLVGCLFLNAQNKQTVWEIVKPLRELGIPAAGIVDIDVFKEGGAVWKKPLVGAFIPTISHTALQAQRTDLLTAFKKTNKDMKRDGGIQVLSEEDREACNNLLNTLNEYGVFVVPNGELESWLSTLDVNRNKSVWLFEVFKKMGDNPDDAGYLNPEEGDVWDFIGLISMWVGNNSRKGIPS